MKVSQALLILVLVISSSFSYADTRCAQASAGNTISYDELDNCLLDEGVLLEVHGIVPMSSMFVVTYRNPNNFFQSVHLSLIGTDSNTRSMISSLRRHDVILVQGNINTEIPLPQRHIMASSISLIERSPESMPADEYTYEALPDSILKMTELTAKVHAVYGDGRVLVLEYKDYVVPVYVKEQWLEQTKNLFRGDIVSIKYTVQQGPRRPVHLNLDPARTDAFTVLNSVVVGHGTPTKRMGKLLQFPKSPMVKFPVFAIDVDMGDGVFLPHTVLSFTDPELFKQAREMLQAAWDRHPTAVRSYRNKFINDSLTVTVSGTYNMIDPLQANPQIIINSLADIVIQEN